MNTQYCWVDFNKTFAIAHTSARQARCAASYSINGAVYLESLLRNTNWTQFEISWGNYFDIAVLSALRASSFGLLWIKQTQDVYLRTSTSDEIAYWIQQGIKHYTLQWQNRWRTGISETMLIENALGWQKQFTIKSLQHGTGPWTSLTFYWFPYNTMWLMTILNRSLVAESSNYFRANTASGAAISIEAWAAFHPSRNSPSLLVRQYIGPMPSIDCFFIAVPSEVYKVYHTFRNIFYSALFTNSSFEAIYSKLPATQSFKPTPMNWAMPNQKYYGGNPLCLTQPATSFVQDTIAFDHACATEPNPFSIVASPESLVFATMMVGSIDSTNLCKLQCLSSFTHYFNEILTTSNTFFQPTRNSLLLEQINNATTAIIQLNPEIIQFSSLNDTWSLLRQPLVDIKEPAWSFYGWLMIYNWIEGFRGVVSFQGDSGTLALVSSPYETKYTPTSSDLELKAASIGVLYILIYGSGLLVIVATIVLYIALRSRLCIIPKNIFFFNRIVGSVWIGRPILLLRGVTALILLCTSQTTLIYSRGMTHFEFIPRPLYMSMIISGEATWITYTIHDVLLLHARDWTQIYGPLSCGLTWLCLVLLEIFAPVRVTASLDRSCYSQDMDYNVICSSGVVSIGSFERVLSLFGIHLSCILVTLFGMGLLKKRQEKKFDVPSVVPGVAEAFLSPWYSDEEDWTIDKASCTMCGLVPFRIWDKSYTFDVKLWLLLNAHEIHTTMQRSFHLRKPAVKNGPVFLPIELTGSTVPQFPWRRQLNRILATAGFFYIIASVTTSISYLEVSSVNLANDLCWATFNLTGAHAFFASWVNEQLILGMTKETFQLDRADIIQPGDFSDVTAAIDASAIYGARLQYDGLSTIRNAINGLRAADSCYLPWIFSPYCYMDFNKYWEVAATANRQQRCITQQSNAAVYMEAFLRNTIWSEWINCWGEAFSIGIQAYLITSDAGVMWLANTQAAATLPWAPWAMEANYWQQSNLTSYTTQWQNYKQIGLVNTYSITNAFGISYPFELQNQFGLFRLNSQTTYKMYWGLANDFGVILQNATSGRSLIRASPDFIYTNRSLESIMVCNSILATPFNSKFDSVRSALGPFGSVDMLFVPIPPKVLVLVRNIAAAGRSYISTNFAIQADYFSFSTSSAVHPIPNSWINLQVSCYGGTVLCSEIINSGDNRLIAGLANLVSYNLECTTNGVYTQVQPNREFMVLSALLSGIATNDSVDLNHICSQDVSNVAGCKSYLNQTLHFSRQILMGIDDSIVSQMQIAKSLLSSLNIQLMQFIAPNATSPMTILSTNILDPNDTTFHFFGYWFLCDWFIGNRDVITFQGDNGSITLLTEYTESLSEAVAEWQYPNTIAIYARSGVIYITFTMIGVALCVLNYIALCHGHIEGINMLELNRVGAVVWIGRPLLYLRSMTAITLLSTGLLELEFSGTISKFAITTMPWYKTWLAASEVTWFATIVNDVIMIYTQGYTSYYATPNSMLIWAITAAWSRYYPVEHIVTIERVCTMEQIDFQIVCTSGSIVIGSISRLVWLMIIVITCSMSLYCLVRCMVPSQPVSCSSSLFLYAGAKYLFFQENWMHNNIYYLDRASAVLTGILSYRYGDTMIAFDIKVWRIFWIPLASNNLNQNQIQGDMAFRIEHGIPLNN
ncbi:hypothetical protein THRCLA_23438 [Thraustotheca clavata]|uniref:Uncharacterized protein n=1 Tax=Thraustotheca clavata TaxID=74557 RepID=A0A1V9Y533_9STRA|nr:hypothetical protein THRCLA_23438 [Thraustotheca clavata]